MPVAVVLDGANGVLHMPCIQSLTIEMPWNPNLGMNKEQGWNALNFWWTPHSWIDDISIVNAGETRQPAGGNSPGSLIT